MSWFSRVLTKIPPDPLDPEYGVNYIKRLMSAGPSSVVILDGDIYVGPRDASGPASYTIQRKPKHVQDALWRAIYDNDFVPTLGSQSHPQRYNNEPWTPARGQQDQMDPDGR